MSKNEIAKPHSGDTTPLASSEASLPPGLLCSPYDALRAALRGNRPKAVKEAILGEMRRREAQEGRESHRYNSEEFWT